MIRIGVCSKLNGDIIFDPEFCLTLKINNKKIVEVEIMRYYSQTMLGLFEIDENDILYGMGSKVKDEYGLKRRFSSFMDNMVENGPYLTKPKNVKRYDKTLADKTVIRITLDNEVSLIKIEPN